MADRVADQPADQADQASGIDLMRAADRAGLPPAAAEPPAPQRRPPRRRTAAAAAGAPAVEPVAAVQEAPPPRAARAPRGRGAGETRVRLAPDLPPVNLAIRVRKPLDDGLADQIHALRRDGVRTSKVELIEMLLWESAGATPEALRERLRTFPGVGTARARRPPRRLPRPAGTGPETPPAGPPGGPAGKTSVCF